MQPKSKKGNELWLMLAVVLLLVAGSVAEALGLLPPGTLAALRGALLHGAHLAVQAVATYAS